MIKSISLRMSPLNAAMKTLLLIVLLSYVDLISSEETLSPRVVIIGAGPSGIAAASMLFANGFNNVTILEAEDRIGGRIYSVTMGDYLVDIGGQWVHGEEDNMSFELAWPLGLLERFNETGLIRMVKFFMSSGQEIPVEASTGLVGYHISCIEDLPEDTSDLKTGSLGEYMDKVLGKYFDNHTEIDPDQRQPLLNFLNLFELALHAAPDWHQVSLKQLKESFENAGELQINWKNRTYATILDVLMKKYPNPEEELPVEKNTMLNSKVKKIHYDMSDGSKKVVTEDDKEYPADHIIFTGSLGVLKADHEKLFDPPLPESKVTAIKDIGMGGVAKIFLYYDNPWWTNDIYIRGMVWTDADRKELESDPKKKWMLSVYQVIPVENKPKLLCVWMTGPYVKDMEMMPEDDVRNGTLGLLNRFFGKAYNLTEPTMMKRSRWMTNDNFRGTYSYPTLESEKSKSYPSNLAEPIIKDGKPMLQFAGEATAKYYATVHGAISSGRREAQRVMDLYPQKLSIL